jgi:hypothetical protein
MLSLLQFKGGLSPKDPYHEGMVPTLALLGGGGAFEGRA